MRIVRVILVGLMITSGAVSCFAHPAWQERQNDSHPAHPNTQNQGQFHLQGPGPHKGDWLRQNWNKPEPQQEQQLRQDPHFRSLAPEQQQKLIDRLHHFDNLPPSEKTRILNRMEMFEHLSPTQQRAAQGLFQHYKAMPPDRQGKVNQAYRQLRDLPPDQRNQLLDSNEYRNNFSDDELNLLRGMSDLTAQNH